MIAAEISNVCGRPMQFNVTLKTQEPEQPAEKVEIPLQVNILVNAFKGTIVAGRMNYSKTHRQLKNSLKNFNRSLQIFVQKALLAAAW